MSIDRLASGAPVGDEPPTAKGRRTRQRILEAARGVFAESGYVGARMSDVALAASLSMGGLYRYFGSKEELFEALIAGLHDELFAESTGGGHDLAREPRAALLAANRGYLEVYADNRDVMRAFIEAANVDERFRRLWWTMRERHVGRFLSALRHADVDVDGDEARRLTEALAAMVEQSAYIWFAHGTADGRAVEAEQAAATVTRIWVRALFDAP